MGSIADSTAPGGGNPGGGEATGSYETDPLGRLPTGAAQLAILCARGNGDPVSRAFCASSTPPPIGNLVDLEHLVGLDFGAAVTPSFALTSHSSSLVMRYTSPINPRAILFTRPNFGGQPRAGNPLPNPEYVALGFARGEQFVELAAKDTTAGGALRFFLFRFQQACNQAPGGCNFGDLFSPDIEQSFLSYTLYEDQDIRNTIFDCAVCHQPGGPGTQKMLRMQEIQPVWEHFLFDEPQGNALLYQDYLAAHDASESYAGIPGGMVKPRMPCSDNPSSNCAGPPLLEAFVENNGFVNQPNEFLTPTISAEVEASNPLQPSVNVPPGVSTTWQGLYNNYLSGHAIPPPYHDFRVSDAGKLATLAAGYRAVLGGAMPRSAMPDLRTVFLDAALPDMTIRARPGQTGRQVLQQICSECHNSHLDQSQSRANFNVETLDTLAPGEKQYAVARIHLRKDDANHMPPLRFRELTPEEIDLVTQELQR
jgi:mono/diheme cytochrome c family protein